MTIFRGTQSPIEGDTGKSGWKKNGFFTVMMSSLLLWSLFFSLSSCNGICSDIKTFTDPKNGYSIRYPATCQLQSYPESKDLVKADIVLDKNTGLQVRVYDTTMEFGAFCDWYLEQFKKDMERYYKGSSMKTLETKNTFIGKNSGCVISLDFQRTDSRWFFKEYLIPGNGKVFVLQSGTLYELRAKNEPLMDYIADSFVINK